jgi:hypothetical protein
MTWMLAARIPNDDLDSEIGAAEAYRSAVISSHNLVAAAGDANVVPPWAVELIGNVQQIANDVNLVRTQVQVDDTITDLTTRRTGD